MVEIAHSFIADILPFSWASYAFMRNALMGIVLAAPMFGLLGTMVVSNRMVFFSDVLGHAALTGVAIGVLLGVTDVSWSVVVFCSLLAVLVNLFQAHTNSSSDTVLGVFFAVVVAVGVVILSKGGGFSKYTSFLIGDILTVSVKQVEILFFLFVSVAAFWFIAGNVLLLSSLNHAIARSRGIPVKAVEIMFSVLVAVVVAVCIKFVGILIINSFLVLPAAAARLVSRRFSDYTFLSVIISIVCGVAGLLVSYYWNTAAGATIVLFCALAYVIALAVKWIMKRG
jgi:zinc transport system permease protein